MSKPKPCVSIDVQFYFMFWCKFLCVRRKKKVAKTLSNIHIDQHELTNVMAKIHINPTCYIYFLYHNCRKWMMFCRVVTEHTLLACWEPNPSEWNKWAPNSADSFSVLPQFDIKESSGTPSLLWTASSNVEKLSLLFTHIVYKSFRATIISYSEEYQLEKCFFLSSMQSMKLRSSGTRHGWDAVNMGRGPNTCLARHLYTFASNTSFTVFSVT